MSKYQLVESSNRLPVQQKLGERRKPLLVASAAVFCGSTIGLIYLYQTVLLMYLFAGLAGISTLSFTCLYFMPEPKKRNLALESKREQAVLSSFKDRELTYEELKKSTGFHEEILLQTLKSLVDQELIVEELNMENSQWTYKVSSNFYLEQVNEGLDNDLESRMKSRGLTK